jgi:GR25 family glycosyltransferase involved in LPS biosynthesis
MKNLIKFISNEDHIDNNFVSNKSTDIGMIKTKEIIPSKLCNELNSTLNTPFNENIVKSNIKNIDHIFIVNLEKCPKKKNYIKNFFDKYKIDINFFKAINGWALSMDTLKNIGTKFEKNMDNFENLIDNRHDNGLATRYDEGSHTGQFNEYYERMYERDENCWYIHGMAPGQIGCILSHLNIYKNALALKMKTIMICEDDCQINENPHSISNYLNELNTLTNNDWDMLYLDKEQIYNGEEIIQSGRVVHPHLDNSKYALEHLNFTINEKISENIRRVGARFGTYGYVISESGMKKILEWHLIHGIWSPADILCVSNLKKYTLLKNIIIHNDDMYKYSSVGCQIKKPNFN